ncbi:MAG: glycosyltransferase [Alkalilacustris sp.]
MDCVMGEGVVDTVNGKETGTEALLSVIIPAHNETGYIGDCLDSLCRQTPDAGPAEVIVAANGCTDDTVAVARARAPALAARGWALTVLDIPESGKPGALNAADAVARGAWRLYLDADIRCAPDLLSQLRTVLGRPQPVYATGRLQLAPARSWITRRYGDFWMRVPFNRGGAVGAGLYAVNAPARARWGSYPPIISDDSFARLQFRAEERVEVPAAYDWPVAEGFRALVRVRRRQDAGMAELFRLYPELAHNEEKVRPGISGTLRLAHEAPISFLVYALVVLAVRSRRATGTWARGR